VLLIDEIDKSNINLPNDLLNLLEEGQFEITELVRLAEEETDDDGSPDQQQEPLPQTREPMQVRTADDLRVPIEGGKIRCDAFPLIVMTSNGERDFPPAFLRRCLRVEMPKPEGSDLHNIVAAHLTQAVANQIDDLIQRFIKKTDQEAKQLATDQLLNAVYLRQYGAELAEDSELEKLILAALSNIGGGG
jgi:MoxR-like ATPase